MSPFVFAADAFLASRLHVFKRGDSRHTAGGDIVSTILIVILVLILIGLLPTWPYSSGWGYYPSGGLGLILLIIVILALTGRL